MDPKRFLARHFSAKPELRNHPTLRWLGDRIHDPELWHFGRRSVAGAVGAGLFLAFIPLPIQMLLCVPTALLLRVNIPIIFSAIWVTNPITMAPALLFAYHVGAFLSGAPHRLAELKVETSFAGFANLVAEVGYPLLIGCFVCGLVAALLGNLAVRLLWRISLYFRKRERRRRFFKRN